MTHNGKKHDLQSAALLLFFLSLLGLLSTTTTGEIMSMQLSRDEFVQLAGYGEKKLSSVLIMGSIQCDACLHPGSELQTSDIEGAKVAVACKTEGKRNTDWAHGMTDELGEFMIDLPSELHALPALEKSCIVRILYLPKSSHCRITHIKSKPIKLSSIGNGIRVYTTGTISLNQRSKASHECLKKSDVA